MNLNISVLLFRGSRSSLKKTKIAEAQQRILIVLLFIVAASAVTEAVLRLCFPSAISPWRLFASGFQGQRNLIEAWMKSKQQQQQLGDCGMQKAIFLSYKNESQMLQRASQVHNRTSTSFETIHQTPSIAFLFLVRGPIPHEILWERFFNTSPQSNLYSIYVHAHPKFEFHKHSFFDCKQIPSKRVARFSFSVVDAMRRLLAHALLDMTSNNQRFIFVCESTIPIQNFPYVYNYLIHHDLSFVQAFKPPREYYSWQTLPEFSQKLLRKGELWMALTRKHASMVVGDITIYKKFKANCKRSIRVCTPDEQYIQTLLSLQDPLHIANKTIMYVDWSHANLQRGSPSSFSKLQISPHLIQKIKNKRQSLVIPNAIKMEKQVNYCENSCPRIYFNYGFVPYLFARKFTKDATPRLARLSTKFLGY